MDRLGLLLFAAVGVLFGAPYLFTKVAVEEVDPAFVALVRVALAAALLTLAASPARLVALLRARPGPVLVLAALQFALPFALVAWAAQHLASSLVGFLIATEPLLVAALAGMLDARERGDRRSGAGMLAGLAGVGLLLGPDVAGTARELLAAAAVLLATACYAAAGLLLGRLGAGVERRELLPAALWVAAVLLLPVAAPALPGALPGPDTIASLLALGALCTALAFPVWFALIDRAGARQAALVTYVNPVIALALGAAVLGEPVTGTAVAGLALILAGTWLGTRPRAATPSVELVAARAPNPTGGPGA